MDPLLTPRAIGWPREGGAAKAKHVARVPRKEQEITEVIERLCGVAVPLALKCSCYSKY